MTKKVKTVHLHVPKLQELQKVKVTVPVRNVVYGETCKVSKTTGVKVYFSAEETNPEIISASVKEKGLSGNCEDGSKCTSKKKSDVKS